MANEQHVTILLHDGVDIWNTWRKSQPQIRRPGVIMADLSGADLSGVNLSGADLSRVDLSRANLTGANLSGANLSGANLFDATLIGATLIGATLIGAKLEDALLDEANLSGADFEGADLSGAYFRGTNLREAKLNRATLGGADFGGADLWSADLSGANLRRADLNEALLSRANLSGADLSEAHLEEAICISTNFSHANLSDCSVYGIAAWDVNLDNATQTNLRVAPYLKAALTVDNLEVAQFLYLLIRSQKARDVFDTLTSKVVFILGRFGERNANLDALREALRNHPNGYIPVLYDVDPHTHKPVLETVKILANLARFVVANLTDPSMVRSELSYITANVPTVPVQSLIEEGAGLPAEYSTWQTRRSFLPLYRYADFDQLIANLTTHIIEPVERHVQARRISDGHGS